VLQIIGHDRDQLHDEQQIDERRDEPEQDLEQPRLRQRDHAERAIARAQRDVGMLPQTLQRAVRPAEALLRQPHDRVGASVQATASASKMAR